MRPPPARIIVSALAGLIAFGVYLRTVAPQVTLIDSGEFVLASRVLGNPHSPGYPAFCVLGHTFLQLPFGNDAYRLGVMSAAGGALCAAMTCLMVSGLTGSVWLGAMSGLTMAWGITFWEQAAMTEVYCIALAFCILMVALVLWPLWRQGLSGQSRSSLTRRMALFGFVLGVGAGFHQFVLFFGPGLLVAAWILEGRRFIEPRRLSILAVGLLLGVSVNLYLPVRASTLPVYAWEFPVSAEQFDRLVSTKNFNDQRFVRSYDQLAGFLWNFQDALIKQYPWPVLVLAVMGAVVSRRKRQAVFWALVPMWLIDSIVGTVYFNLDEKFYDTLRVFYIPGHWAVAVLAAIGLQESIASHIAKLRERFVRLVFAASCVLLCGWTLTRNIGESDRSQEYFVFDWGRAHLLSLPPRTTLVFSSDEGFVLWCLQYCMGMRPDVAVVSFEIFENPDILHHPAWWYWEQTQRNYPWTRFPSSGERAAQLSSITSQTPLFTTFWSGDYALSLLDGGLHFVPRCPGFEIAKEGTGFDSDDFLERFTAFSLRNPPVSEGQRMIADRDYLDSYLTTLMAALKEIPPSDTARRLHIEERVKHLDSRLLVPEGALNIR